MRGCFLHYAQSQSLWRNFLTIGLKSEYESSNELKKWFKMFIALAFIPKESISAAFNLLKESRPKNICIKKLEDFTSYFDAIWLNGRTNKNGVFRKPFPADQWNFYDYLESYDPNTNNNVEAYNGKINSIFGKHPNFLKFMDKLQSEHISIAGRMHLIEIANYRIRRKHAGNLQRKILYCWQK